MSMMTKLNLVDVVRQYSIRVGTIESYANFHILKTDRGPKLLKVWEDITLLEQANHFREAVAKAGFRKIDRFIRTKEGDPYVVYKQKGYTLTDVVDGIIPTEKREMDLQIIGKTLGEFHIAVEQMDINNQDTFISWTNRFQRGQENLLMIEEKIKRKKTRTLLDEEVLNELTKYQKQIKQSIQMAKQAENSYFRNGKTPKWCHGQLNLNSFRVDEYGQGWIIDIGMPIVDVSAYDAAKLIAFLYKKSEYHLRSIDHLLSGYKEIKDFETEDKLWILTYVAYPHNLWKFLYVYYVAKLPKLEGLEERFKLLVDEQIKFDELYHHLFSYFEL